MNRKGQTAFTLFCILSIGGILTLFSQADALKKGARFRSMNVSTPEHEIFRKAVPTAIESGAVLKSSRDEKYNRNPSSSRREQPVRLKLR